MIHVALLPELMPGRDRSAEQHRSGRERVIIVDTLRASTTMITALENGAAGIVPVGTIDQAHVAANRFSSEEIVLAGERGGLRIDQFDLGNSPGEFSPRHIEGKTIIMATTNGTRAIQHCSDARSLTIGSILNAGSVARHALGLPPEVSETDQQRLIIVCAGTDGDVSQDDILGAGAIIDQMLQIEPSMEMDDAGLTAHDLYLAHQSNLEQALSRTAHGRRLLRLGFEDDVARAADLNGSRVVPVRDATGVLRVFHDERRPPADTGT